MLCITHSLNRQNTLLISKAYTNIFFIAPIKSIWIVSDIRRKTDINWFKNTYGDKIKTLRITADLEERKKRGWVFTAGVDDVTSECDLDDYDLWDLKLSNNNDEEFKLGMKKILNLLSN